ncbi:MAG: hypothetical protein OEV92_01185 [Nitrospinota bacterium]|nr:hypothetical protein [Nitrospinota bacterium]
MNVALWRVIGNQPIRGMGFFFAWRACVSYPKGKQRLICFQGEIASQLATFYSILMSDYTKIVLFAQFIVQISQSDMIHNLAINRFQRNIPPGHLAAAELNNSA